MPVNEAVCERQSEDSAPETAGLDCRLERRGNPPFGLLIVFSIGSYLAQSQVAAIGNSSLLRETFRFLFTSLSARDQANAGVFIETLAWRALACSAFGRESVNTPCS